MPDLKALQEFLKNRPDPEALDAFLKNMSDPIACSFCGLREGDLRHNQKTGGKIVHVVQGPMAAICDGCVELCQDVLNKGAKPD